MPLPESVAELVERFEASRSEYHKGHYNETQTRVDYVNPLFAALGWDMGNRDGLSELLREVVHEDAIKIGGTTKAPDYSFRIGGARKFFVETKKPSVNLYLMEAPAFQLRRYAWTVKMPLSILTNFEEFAVYDTRVPPDKKDAAKTARLDHFRYTDYADKWEEIAARFSHEAVLSGAFDRYAEQARDKRISVPVDVAFLAEISGWREKLARNIVQNNPGLGPRELNYAVQMIIDRLIFLRISEDRGVEPDFLLQPLMNRGGHVYPRLLDIFHRADARYNSGLFHFKTEPGREGPDDVTPRLTIDDRPLREIIASVYYPESPFEFSVFPADILGQVYEQFLGKVIHVSGRTAEVEDKPEVKKAGGVYYTPTYIVDYIVRNTVGKLIDGKTPAQVAKLTVLDPACGSGSFLLGAYQFLLDWHLKYYTETDRAKWARGKAPTIYLFKKDAVGGELWRLTTAEKKRILLANLYGVDIDTQAVEVTKLSLLLKVLEGESAELIDNTLKLLQERALPDLENNIKCGNSLIGPDFYADKKLEGFDLNARLKINAFDWKAAFPKVMAGGGFDAVIGNPPYNKVSGVAQPYEMAYFKSKYKSGNYKIELYALFAERSLQLLSANGLHSFIVPNSFLTGVYLRPLRALLAEASALDELFLLKDVQVFHDAKLDSVVYTTRNSKPADDSVLVLRIANQTLASQDHQVLTIKLSDWLQTKGLEFRVSGSEAISQIFRKAHTIIKPMGDVATVHLGLILESNSLMSKTVTEQSPNPILLGRDVARYEVAKAQYYFNFGKDKIVGGTKNPAVYKSGPRILLQAIRNLKLPVRLVATMVPQNTYTMGTIHNVVLRDNHGDLTIHYLLGLLNSRLFNVFYSTNFPEHRIKGAYLESLPVRVIDFSKSAEKAKHDRMVSLVEQMLKLHKDKAGARLGQEKAMLQQQIEATDAQIDRLVYDLYGLTEEEIKIVETAG